MNSKIVTRIIDSYDSSLFDSVVNNINPFPLSFIREASPAAVKDYQQHLIEQGFNKGIVFGTFYKEKLAATATLIRLDWDSQHFGFECYTISNCYANPANDKKELLESAKHLFAELISVGKSKKIKFIYTSISSWNTSIANGLQENNFRYILTWLDGFSKSTEISDYSYSVIDGHSIELATEDEIAIYSEMAAENYFKGGRFFLDANFDPAFVRSMYAKLVRSSFENGDIMISYRISNTPVGLFVCKKITASDFFGGKRIAPLRFLVVSPEVRKKGISKDLFNYTLRYLSEQSDYITTGLEIHNLPSLNLHTKMNFKFHYTHNVFHWWDTTND